MTAYDIIQDLLKQNPDFFKRYEQLAQTYYKYVTVHDTDSIPRAHCTALLELLTQSGYKLNKVIPENDVVYLSGNVINFKKKG